MSKRLRTSERIAKTEPKKPYSPVIGLRQKSVGQDKSKILKRWWKEHKKSIHNADVKQKELVNEVERLEKLQSEMETKVFQLQTENEQLKYELESQRVVLLKGNTMCAEIKKESHWPSMLKMIGDAILVLMGIIMYRTQSITRLRALQEVIFTNQLYGPVATETVVKEMSKAYARKYVFVAWKVLKSIDLSINGGINFTGVEALRSVENLSAYERGFLPGRSSIVRCAAELHGLGQTLIPFYKVDSELGEMYQFDYEKMVRYVLKLFCLDEIAQRERVELSITLDGAELTKDLCHLTFGIKVTDARAIDPRDGSPLACQEDGIIGNLFRIQSRNYCFVVKTLLGKDSKAAYQEFSDVFQFFEMLLNNGLPKNENGPKLMPLLIWSPQDLSSIWKSLNTGGGAKKTGDKHFCHLCPCTGEQIASFLVDSNRCAMCKENNRERCYHWTVGDENSVTQFQQELENKLEEYSQAFTNTYDTVISQSKIVYNPCAVNRYGDKNNIDFDTSHEENSDLDCIFFHSLVNSELMLRRIPNHGTLEDKRERLKQHLMLEQQIKRIKAAVLRTQEGKEAALILILQAIPCIMHLENRVGEKLIACLLHIGATRYRRDRRSTSLDGYVKRIMDIVRKQILGTTIRPSQWKFPLSENGKEVGRVSLSNNKTRGFVEHLHLLIEEMFEGNLNADERRQKNDWRDMIVEYNMAMQILRKHSEYTDEDIRRFQYLIDNFFEKYVAETGCEGITNYIHMLASGHIQYYMQVHRNLYKYSQQGWESLNSKYKQVFFRHTQRGGNYGIGTQESERTYLGPIMRAFQREMLWISGDAEEYFYVKKNMNDTY